MIYEPLTYSKNKVINYKHVEGDQHNEYIVAGCVQKRSLTTSDSCTHVT